MCNLSEPRFLLRHRAGLTLIELVVVMTLLVLLAFIAAPSFVNTAKRAQVRTGAQQVLAVLRYARAKAVSLGRPVLVAFDREQNTFRVLLPADLIEERVAVTSQPLPTAVTGTIELTDEDWWQLAGERIETLDVNQFAEDPSPMGRERRLPDGVTIASLRDLDTNEELNLLAFYPDGTASGVLIVLEGERGVVALTVAPTTGSIQMQELEPEEATRLR